MALDVVLNGKSFFSLNESVVIAKSQMLLHLF